MQRRIFIKSTGLLAATTLFPEILRAESAKEKLPSFGIILGNTGGNWIKNNPKECIESSARYLKELRF